MSSIRSHAAAIACLALLAGATHAAPILDQITGGLASGLYRSQASASGVTACMDDFEINGTQGVGGQGAFAIDQIESVFRVQGGAFAPQGFRVNIYTNDGNPLRDHVRTMLEGDRFSRIVQVGDPALSFSPLGLESGFPGDFLVSFNFGPSGPVLPLGSYFLSVVAIELNPTIEYFVVGSSTSAVGTPNDVFRVNNQGPLGTISDFADNAAFRVNGVPGPGAAGLLGLAGLLAARRRR
jgi:MYXO-CTERM domain-containing protein